VKIMFGNDHESYVEMNLVGNSPWIFFVWNSGGRTERRNILRKFRSLISVIALVSSGM
jgi:hypothetical protein